MKQSHSSALNYVISMNPYKIGLMLDAFNFQNVANFFQFSHQAGQ